MKKSKVFFKDEQVGFLEESGSGSRFIYNEGWNQQIACVFPVYQRLHEWRDGVHPFFDNLSSEGDLKRIQAINAQIDKNDTFSLISKYGHDCIGAISLEELLPQLVREREENRNRSALEVNKTVSGVQEKRLAYKRGNKYFISTATDPALYIAKLSTEKLEHSVWNEAITLSLAQEVLGKEKVVEFKHTSLEREADLALIVKRFDRTEDEQKLRMEDFAQILNIKSKDKYKASYEDIAKGIDLYSHNPKIDKLHFFQLLVFNCLVGNTDAHLKNFALHENSQGVLRLSPAYDLVNTYLYIKDGYNHQRLALMMDGQELEYTEVTYKILESFGLSIGLNHKLIGESIKMLAIKLKASKKFKEISEAHIQADDFRYKYKRVVEESCQRILTK